MPHDQTIPIKSAAKIGLWFMGHLCHFCLLVAIPLYAADTVTISGAKKGEAPILRHGTIVEYTGEELTLATTGDLRSPISADRVLEIQSTRCRSEPLGDAARQSGDLAGALKAYEAALAEESRPWALRKIRAKLIACYEWSDQPELAGDTFLQIVAQDPHSQYFATIPLPWKNAAPNAAVSARAKEWMSQRSNPAAELLGASWLLQTDKPAAMKVLTSLASDLDPRIAPLAVAQLWRTKLISATVDDLALWKQMLNRLPDSLRGGLLLLIAELELRLKQPENAMLTFLQAALARDQREIIAVTGLLAAGKLLEQQGRSADAVRLYRELLQQQPIGGKINAVQERLIELERKGP